MQQKTPNDLYPLGYGDLNTAIFGLLKKKKCYQGSIVQNKEDSAPLDFLSPSGETVAHLFNIESKKPIKCAVFTAVQDKNVNQFFPELKDRLAEYLKFIKDKNPDIQNLFIPVFQEGHPTLLHIKWLPDEKRVENVTLYDPKGIFPRIFYNTDLIKQAIQDSFDLKNLTVERHFLGWQGLFDFKTGGDRIVNALEGIIDSYGSSEEIKLSQGSTFNEIKNEILQKVNIFFRWLYTCFGVPPLLIIPRLRKERGIDSDRDELYEKTQIKVNDESDFDIELKVIKKPTETDTDTDTKDFSPFLRVSHDESEEEISSDEELKDIEGQLKIICGYPIFFLNCEDNISENLVNSKKTKGQGPGFA